MNNSELFIALLLSPAQEFVTSVNKFIQFITSLLGLKFYFEYK